MQYIRVYNILYNIYYCISDKYMYNTMLLKCKEGLTHNKTYKIEEVIPKHGKQVWHTQDI
jgi:hypothetical protein